MGHVALPVHEAIQRSAALCSLTIDEYDRMIAAGAFAESARLELIEGELRTRTPIGPLHEVAVDLLTELSILQISRRPICVRVQNSIGLPGLDSAPEPDLVGFKQADDRRGRAQSPDLRLVIEVSDSEIEYDRLVKGPLSARTGIPEYRLIDIEDSTIEVPRAPNDGRYRVGQTVGLGDSLSPLTLPEAQLSVGWLFGIEG